jgi:hypothetical protein
MGWYIQVNGQLFARCDHSLGYFGFFRSKMPISSSYPQIEIPNVDIWDFLFERKDKPYPNEKGELVVNHNLVTQMLMK